MQTPDTTKGKHVSQQGKAHMEASENIYGYRFLFSCTARTVEAKLISCMDRCAVVLISVILRGVSRGCSPAARGI